MVTAAGGSDFQGSLVYTGSGGRRGSVRIGDAERRVACGVDGAVASAYDADEEEAMLRAVCCCCNRSSSDSSFQLVGVLKSASEETS